MCHIYDRDFMSNEFDADTQRDLGWKILYERRNRNIENDPLWNIANW